MVTCPYLKCYYIYIYVKLIFLLHWTILLLQVSQFATDFLKRRDGGKALAPAGPGDVPMAAKPKGQQAVPGKKKAQPPAQATQKAK